MQKKLFTILLSTLLFLASAGSVHAFPKELFVSFAFPVSQLPADQDTLAMPRAIAPLATASATPLTWYLSFDALGNSETTDYFYQLSQQPNQEIAGWINPPTGSVPEVRAKYIDDYFARFYQVFGYFPSSVYSRYLDSYTLDYLQRHYSVVAALLEPNLGVFPYFSYYPSTHNTLIPAQDADHRIKINVSTYNPPDFFGNPISSGNIDTVIPEFALKDLNESTRLVLGFANTTPPQEAADEFTALLDSVLHYRHPLSINRLTVSQFGTWFAQYYPLTSPAYHYRATRGDQTVVYYHNPFYQIRLEQISGQTQIDHLTVFNQRFTEDFRNSRDFAPVYRPYIYSLVKTDQSIPVDFNLNTDYSSQFWRLTIKDGDKQLRFLPQQIETKNLELGLPDSPQINSSSTEQLHIYKFDSNWLPFSTSPKQFTINGLKLLLLFSVFYLVFKKLGFVSNLRFSISNLIIIIFGSLIWSITTFKSGSHTIFGLSFWGPQGHDAFVHLSLIESFKQSLWPLNNPTLAGTSVVNYHIAFDYLTALLSRFLNIPALDLYFRYLPPLMAVSIGLLSASLLRKWKFSQGASLISLFLIYFAGSLGFIPHFLSQFSPWGGESLFWANQAASTLLNPPFAMSLVVLLLWLNIFAAKLTWGRVVTLSLLGALLIQVKSYAAVLLIISLGIHLLLALLSRRVTRQLLVLITLTVILIPIFLLPVYSQSQSLFVFSPLWFSRSLVSSFDRLPWGSAANALVNYPVNGQLLRFVALEVLLALIFIIGNFGIRLFALPFLLRRQTRPELMVIAIIVAVGTILPLLVIQTANPWNTIQFMYYSLFFAALLSGPALAALLYRQQNLFQFVPISLLLLVIAVTTTLGTLKDYLSPTPASFVGYTELFSLDTLSRQPAGAVITPEFNLPLSRSYPDPKPVFAYTSTAYISALSGQPTYLSDEINLLISGIPFNRQSQLQQRFYRTDDLSFMSTFLDDHQIRYVYTNPQFPTVALPPNLTPIFQSGYYDLYTTDLD